MVLAISQQGTLPGQTTALGCSQVHKALVFRKKKSRHALRPVGCAVCFCLLIINNYIAAQTVFPYALNKHTEAGLVISGNVFNIGGYVLASKTKSLTPSDLAALDAGKIFPAFDRKATRQFSFAAKKRSDYLLLSSYLIPAALALSPQCRTMQQGKVVAVMGLETMLLSNGLTQLVKNTVRRPRPFTYNPDAPASWKTGKDAQRSFFSGHTSTSAAACFFTATVFSALYPESKWRPAVWTGAAALPLAIGYYRYKAGKHFPTDVLTGYIVGGLCGVLIPRWHRI